MHVWLRRQVGKDLIQSSVQCSKLQGACCINAHRRSWCNPASPRNVECFFSLNRGKHSTAEVNLLNLPKGSCNTICPPELQEILVLRKSVYQNCNGLSLPRHR